MTNSTVPSAEAVFEEVRSMVAKLLDQYGLDDLEITPDSRFQEDLGLESIDLVTLGGMLAEHYSESVNLAEYVAELHIDDVIELRLGMLVDFVHSALAAERSATA